LLRKVSRPFGELKPSNPARSGVTELAAKGERDRFLQRALEAMSQSKA
jgi:hypothetical protein